MSGILKLADDSPIFPGDQSHWIASTAVVIGKVELEQNVGIWYGAILRGDNEWIKIGSGTNLQEQVICHTDMGYPLSIGANCTIGHRALLHGCSIGNNSLIGMGAMIMNGAVIGNNCLIGAGSLITEGKMIPDGSLVMGTPGKIIRALQPEEITRLGDSAAHYIVAMNKIRNEASPIY